jgi:gluconokinase
MGAVIVMGVSGCGKTSAGIALAERLGLGFIEGDRLHPAANIARMSAGIPLEDADRWPWLDAIGRALAARPGGTVASCSALKRAYRERLRSAAGRDLRFVFLELSRPELERRMHLREGHFMPATLLASQLAALEPPTGEPGVLTLNGAAALDDIVGAAASWLRGTAEEPSS